MSVDDGAKQGSHVALNIFDASVIGVLFSEIGLDDLVSGKSESFSQAHFEVARCLGSMPATLGGCSPALQQAVSDTVGGRHLDAARILFNTGLFVAQHSQKPKQAWDMLAKLGSNAVHVGNAGKIASSAAGAFITICHVVSDYDNAAKLAEANAKLDELLKVHCRHYKTKLESIYNQLGELFLECAGGHDVDADLRNCNQRLDHLVLIWLEEIVDQLKPVNTNLKFTGSAWPLISVAVATAGIGSLMCLASYEIWTRNVGRRLEKIRPLLRLLGIGIWLRHVISQHTRAQQHLHKYIGRLGRISAKACSIKNALVAQHACMHRSRIVL